MIKRHPDYERIRRSFDTVIGTKSTRVSYQIDAFLLKCIIAFYCSSAIKQCRKRIYSLDFYQIFGS